MRRSVISRAAIMVLLLLMGFGLPLTTAPAHAAEEDVITHLDVRFEVRPDGTVGVTYRLDYRFGETGRRGILFAIIGKEPYGDGIHDARYAISNIAVDSPSGAPDRFEQTTETTSDTEQVTLRIGDADEPLSTREASYVITYDMTGALETHDGYAELYRDVTTDYPHVERYSVAVTAPGGVTDTRCAAGSSECATAVEQDTARYTGNNLPAGQQLTVATQLDPTRIANAQPQLELQPIDTPRTLEVNATTILHPDGVVAVRHTTRYRFPEDSGEVTYAIPVRRPYSDTEDQLFEVTRVTVTDENGARLEVRERLRNLGSRQTLLVSVKPDRATLSAEGFATLTLAYEIRGAFGADQDNAQQVRFRWPLVLESIEPFTEVTGEYRTPGPLVALGCEVGVTREACDIPRAELADQTGIFRLPKDLRATPDPDREQAVVTVAAATVGHPQPVLAESIDRREIQRMGASFLATLGLIAALITGSLVASRRQAFPNQRYAGIPPGVLNPGGPVADDEKVQIPVRFEPPDTDLATAGRLLDGRYLDRHATAEIVDAAVRGVIRIQMRPFTLWQGPRPNLPPEWSTWFDPEVKRIAVAPGEQRATTPAELTGLVGAVRRHQPTPKRAGELFRPVEEVKQLKRSRRRRAWLGFAVLVAALIGLRFALVPVLGDWANGLLFFGILAALVACVIWSRRVGPVPLSGHGTALTDQAVGFRTYLATAEAHQLRFEAGQDIYSRYLPWAVLFGLTDKWTETCQQLVAQGAMPPLRTAWIDQPVVRLGAATTELSYALGRSVAETRATAAAASSSSGGFSSGSGGSSAFSGGGFSSGGGGGGTSTSSW